MTHRNATFAQHAAAVACTLALGLALHGVMSVAGWSSVSKADPDTRFNGQVFETADDVYQFRHMR